MKIIIAGLGNIGNFIFEYLLEEKCEITIIDNNISKIRSINDNQSLVAGVYGDATSINTLKNAKVDDAYLFISCLPNDASNILACQLAHNLNVKYKIAKLTDPNFLSEEWLDMFVHDVFPIDDAIMVGSSIINSIIQQIRYSYLNISDIMEFVDGEMKIASIMIKDNNSSNLIINKTVSNIYQFDANLDNKFTIVAILRDNNINLAKKDDLIKEGDKVYIACEDHYLDDICMLFANNEIEDFLIESYSPNIIIYGNDPFIKTLAIKLSAIYNRVKIVYDKFTEEEKYSLISQLENTNCQLIADDIVNTDYRVNYVHSYNDIIIIMNNLDEDNILKSLLLKYQNVGNLFCILKNDQYEKFLIHHGVNHVIIPDYFIISTVLNYFRNGVIMNSYSFYNKIEAIEYEIDINSYFLGKNVKDLYVDGEFVIVAVFDAQNNKIEINNNTTIQLNNKILIVALRKFLLSLNKKHIGI